MPNYGLVINSRFRPFSYQEMLAPVQQSTEAHQALENAYGELKVKADEWKQIALLEPNSLAANMYNTYANDLDKQAEELAQNGLNPSSRQSMWNLAQRYSSEIDPIAKAFNRREEQIKAQDEILIKDPTHLFDLMANERSIDEYLKNPTLDTLTANYSGALLEQQVAQAVETVKNSLTDKSKLYKLGLPFKYQQALKTGYSIDEVFRAMMKDPSATPFLTNIVDSVMESSGIRNWSSMNNDWRNSDLYKRAEDWALRGLTRAIGTTTFKDYDDNYSAQLSLINRQEKQAARQAGEAAQRKAREEEDEERKNLSIQPLRALEDSTVKEAKKALNKFDRYVKDGFIRKSPKGEYKISEVVKNNPKEIYLSKFVKYLNSISGLNSSSINEKSTYEDYVNYIKNFDDKILNDYYKSLDRNLNDLFRGNKISIPIDNSASDEITSTIWNSASLDRKNQTRELPFVTFIGELGYNTQNAEKLSQQEFGNYKITELWPSQYGITAMLESPDGKDSKEIMIPGQLNPAKIREIKEIIRKADEYVTLSRADNISDDVKQEYANQAEKAYIRAKKESITLFNINKPKTQSIQ